MMKRPALLHVTKCKPARFDTFAARGQLPFSYDPTGNFNDYSLENAAALEMLLEAARAMDVNSASLLARRAFDCLYPINPFAYHGSVELWAALVRYDWPDAPKDWDCRQVIAGRWCDLDGMAAEFVQSQSDTAKVTSIHAISATRIAKAVLREAMELGIPEAEIPAIPEDLTGYPEWFKVAELARRELLTK